jgi:transcriptional regulator with XRE-family HTH domain
MLCHFLIGTDALNVWRMSVNKFLRLPDLLLAGRRGRNLLQKQAAATIGLSHTVLSAMENGRRTPEDLEVLTKLAAAYELDEEATERLLFAAQLDQLVHFCTGTRLEAAVVLLTAVADVHRQLSSTEAAGLLDVVRQIGEGKERIDALSRRARGRQTDQGEDAPM